MKKILLFILLFPVFAFSQNIVTIIGMEKTNEEMTSLASSEIEYYKLDISPGYLDHYYKIELIRVDSSGTKTILSNPVINVDLIVHRTDYKRSDGKVMWDYMAEIKSNDNFSDEYLDIPDCSNKKHLICYVTVKKNEKYLVRVNKGDEHNYEFIIENGEVRGS